MTKKADQMKKYYRTYDYSSRKPVFVEPDDLTEQQRHRLIESDVFCIIPWIHIHGYPTGEAYPCCLSDMDKPIGNMREHTLEDIWNDAPLRKMRTNMLTEKPCGECTKCYEQEEAGFFSMRNSSNKHFGHHIDIVDTTHDNGKLPSFELKYWDIRFNNLCNFRCRTCGDIFSSNWGKEKQSIGWLDKNIPIIQYAGRSKLDIWEQMEKHLPYVEQIYFAGGEPLIMEEHYRVLKWLVANERFDVKLIYNTNFSETKYKDLDVFEIWKLFDSVSVGASLDASGDRGEYMRKGQDWTQTEKNRERMLSVCPDVDFYVSPTLSIMNSLHLPDFHRDWISKGFLKPSDLNVNILQSPDYYRIDVLPKTVKAEVEQKYLEHIEYIKPFDNLTRATSGFSSAINFMTSSDKSELLPAFHKNIEKLDQIRSEDFLTVFPEFKGKL
jgi:organic radical activating enzyme